MQANRPLKLKLLSATIVAVAVVCCAVVTLRNKAVEHEARASNNSLSWGKHKYNGLEEWKYTADFLAQNYPLHLVSPAWMADNNQSRMIRDWIKTETVTRLGLIAVLWFAGSGLILWRHARSQKKL